MRRTMIAVSIAAMLMATAHLCGARTHTAVLAGSSSDPWAFLVGVTYASGWIALWLIGPPLAATMLIALWRRAHVGGPASPQP